MDDRAGGWKKYWTGDEGATVTVAVAVAAVVMADVAAAVVATETEMSW